MDWPFSGVSGLGEGFFRNRGDFRELAAQITDWDYELFRPNQWNIDA